MFDLDGTDIGDGALLAGEVMPEPAEYLSEVQRDGKPLDAGIVYRETWRWLDERGCTRFVSKRLIEQYAQAFARYVQCEQAIRKIFDKSHQRYGYRRVRLQLLRDGWCVSRKLVAKLMRQLGLRSKMRKRKCYNSYRATTSRRADNHLDRRFATEKSNQQWGSDITQFQISGQKLYLSPVMDLCDHSILAHTLSVSPTTKVSALSLKKAFRVAGDPEGVLVYTDQGYHYQHQSWIS